MVINPAHALLLLLLLLSDNTSSDVTMTQRPLSDARTYRESAEGRRRLALSGVTRPECIRRH